MKGTKTHISNSFIIVINKKATFLLAEELFPMLEDTCIDDFLTPKCI